MSCCAEHQALSAGSTYIMSMWSSSPYLTTFLVGPLVLALLLVYPALILLTPQEKKLSASAYTFVTAASPDEPIDLPKLVRLAGNDEEVQLSVVIPAYNEQERLPKMLDEALSHLHALQKQKMPLANAGNLVQDSNGVHVDHQKSAAAKALSNPLETYEIIIVDDGSHDTTAKDVLRYAKDKGLGDKLRLVRLGQNCGKGKAVRHGVLHARGSLIAFCDADGATRFADIGKLALEMQRIVTPAGYAIVCGSRNHLVGTEAVVKRSVLRNFLMHSFHLILSILMRPPNPIAFVRARVPNFLRTSSSASRQTLPVQPPIRDTQYGFKLFTRRSAQAVFPLAHIDRWIFDVELLLLAELASSKTLQQTAAKESVTEKHDTAADPLLRLPLPISEVAVDWREVEGSKIDVLKDSIKMGMDLIVIRLNYALGRWREPGVLPVGLGRDDDCCTK
jgi:dolichyl-phosphate beta-glucosyltransferase